MANHTVAKNAVGEHDVVLTPNVVETVTFSQQVIPVEVISDGTAAVYYTLDGTDPAVGADQCYELPAGSPAVDTRTRGVLDSSAPTVVKLISTGSPTISVQRGN